MYDSPYPDCAAAHEMQHCTGRSTHVPLLYASADNLRKLYQLISSMACVSMLETACMDGTLTASLAAYVDIQL